MGCNRLCTCAGCVEGGAIGGMHVHRGVCTGLCGQTRVGVHETCMERWHMDLLAPSDMKPHKKKGAQLCNIIFYCGMRRQVSANRLWPPSNVCWLTTSGRPVTGKILFFCYNGCEAHRATSLRPNDRFGRWHSEL